MKTINIADDIYDHLVKNTREIAEDASSILRRLLRLPTPASAFTPLAGRSEQSPNGAVAECLNHPRFHVERDAVGRFLFLLGWLHQKHSDKFARVLEITGRRRKYFARSADELEESGTSVNPQKIPNSNIWVITNNDTPKKRRMLSDVMRLLGYGPGDINIATSAVR